MNYFLLQASKQNSPVPKMKTFHFNRQSIPGMQYAGELEGSGLELHCLAPISGKNYVYVPWYMPICIISDDIFGVIRVFVS